jgi:hypothetical protein
MAAAEEEHIRVPVHPADLVAVAAAALARAGPELLVQAPTVGLQQQLIMRAVAAAVRVLLAVIRVETPHRRVA